MFDEVLNALVTETRGARGATLLGFDGIPIASVTTDAWNYDFDPPSVGMELSVALKQIAKAFEILGEADCDEVELGGSGFTILVRIVTEEYFMALILDGQAMIGQARYKLRMAAPDIHSALVD